MFFTNEGINIIQFGTGDIDVSAGLLDDINETIGNVSLSPRKPSEIGTKSERDECMLDTMFGVHTRLIFTNIHSIEVLIKYLEEAKHCMIEDKKEDCQDGKCRL